MKPVYTSCNVCGRGLVGDDEFSAGVCAICANKEAPTYKKAFKDGYYCAVATLVRMHGNSGAATELIRAIGRPSESDELDPLDWETLRENGLVDPGTIQLKIRNTCARKDNQ